MGPVLIVGENSVTLLVALKSSGENNINMFSLLKNVIRLVALVGMLVAVIAKLGDN